MSTLAPGERLRVDGLLVEFAKGPRPVKAVDGVSFAVTAGETLAVVGESGSGKSVTSLALMGLLPSTGRVAGGNMWFRGRDGAAVDLSRLGRRRRRALRGAEMAMIFQEPMSSLNPLFTVGDQIAEMIRLHETISRADAMRRARRMLELVEIPAAASRADDYPHHMSGGMRQRVMIALALACDPTLLIADEPTTALDVTVQAQILDLLRRLQLELGMSILFITHNLGVVAEIAHRAVVMYAGRVVEDAAVSTLFRSQKHPYTRGLLACIPAGRRSGRRQLTPIPGAVPSMDALPPGCSFAPRCSMEIAECGLTPPLLAVAEGHLSRCWRHAAL